MRSAGTGSPSSVVEDAPSLGEVVDAPANDDRIRLAVVVLAVLVSQVFIYPGVPELIVVLGAAADLRAGMWFIVAELAAFVAFAGVWGAMSDSLGRRVPLAVVGAIGGGIAYLALTTLPGLGVGFTGVLVVRAIGGAMTIGAFSLAITMLMDLEGGHGRNMGAAGIAIGFGAALGSVVGGWLTDVDPFAPLYASAAVLVGAGLLIATVQDRAAEDGPDFGEIGERIRARPGLVVPFAFGFIDRLTAGFFALAGVFYFQTFPGIGAFEAGITLALFFLPFAILQYPFGIVSDRIGRFLPVVGGSLAYGFVIIAVGIAPAYWMAAGLMILVGVCGALVAPATMALVTDLVAPDERGAAMGLFNVFGSLGFLAGVIIGGLVGDVFGYLPAFLVAGGLEILIAIAAFPAMRRLAPGVGTDWRLTR